MNNGMCPENGDSNPWKIGFKSCEWVIITRKTSDDLARTDWDDLTREIGIAPAFSSDWCSPVLHPSSGDDVEEISSNLVGLHSGLVAVSCDATFWLRTRCVTHRVTWVSTASEMRLGPNSILEGIDDALAVALADSFQMSRVTEFVRAEGSVPKDVGNTWEDHGTPSKIQWSIGWLPQFWTSQIRELGNVWFAVVNPIMDPIFRERQNWRLWDGGFWSAKSSMIAACGLSIRVYPAFFTTLDRSVHNTV